MTSQSENTKEKLLTSAIKIFAKKGYWKTRVDDIVNDAGVAKGTFYLYFSSKDECFKEVLLTLHKNTLEVMKNAKDIKELSFIFIKRVFQYKELSKVFLFEAIGSSEEFRNLFFEFKSNFKKIFKKFLHDELSLSIIIGFLREIVEQDIIFEGKSLEETIKKVRCFFNNFCFNNK